MQDFHTKTKKTKETKTKTEDCGAFDGQRVSSRGESVLKRKVFPGGWFKLDIQYITSFMIPIYTRHYNQDFLP